MLRIRFLFFFSLSLLCALGAVFLSQHTDRKSYQLSSIESELSAVDKEINSEAQSILNDITRIGSWSSLRHSFFLMDSTEVMAWSDNQFFPDVRRITETHDQFVLYKTNSADYLVKTWKITDTRKLVAFIPLIKEYPISNRYLSTEWNSRIFNDARGLILESTSTEGDEVILNGQVIFRFISDGIYSSRGYWSLIFATASILFFMAAVYVLIRQLSASRKYEWAFLSLSLSFVMLRLILISIDYPSGWVTSKVFDPQYFASAFYNASIGDLFLNSIGILVLCGYVFFTYHHWKALKYLLNYSGWTRFIVGVFFYYHIIFLFSLSFPIY